MMKSKFAIFAVALLISTSMMAQSLQEGINHMYAQRHKSAVATFESLISKNPNNIEATYWLGQAHIAMQDSAGAKEKYEKMVFFCEKYKMPYMVVDTSNLTPDQTVELIMKRIEGRA